MSTQTVENLTKELEGLGLAVMDGKVMLPNQSASPFLYLQQCINDGLSAEEIEHMLKGCEVPQCIDNFVEDLKDGKYAEMTWVLAEKPIKSDIYFEFLDLYKMPVIKMQNDDGVYSAYVGQAMAESLGLQDIEAKVNIKQEWVVRPMSEVLSEFLGSDDPLTADSFQMHIVTNKSGVHGSAVMLDTEFMNGLHDTFGDYFILPSSKHEIIIIRYDSREIEFLTEMIHEVNSTHVSERDRLSDSLYMCVGNGVELARDISM